MATLNELLLILNGVFFFFYREKQIEKLVFYSGWALVGLLIMMILFNLIVILIMNIIGLIAATCKAIKIIKKYFFKDKDKVK